MEFSEKSRNVEGRMLLNGVRDEYPTHHEFVSGESFYLAIFTHTWTHSFVKCSEVWEAMTSVLSPVRLEQVDKEPLLVYAGKRVQASCTLPTHSTTTEHSPSPPNSFILL